jgi:hypothetical protein
VRVSSSTATQAHRRASSSCGAAAACAGDLKGNCHRDLIVAYWPNLDNKTHLTEDRCRMRRTSTPPTSHPPVHRRLSAVYDSPGGVIGGTKYEQGAQSCSCGASCFRRFGAGVTQRYCAFLSSLRGMPPTAKRTRPDGLGITPNAPRLGHIRFGGPILVRDLIQREESGLFASVAEQSDANTL